MAKSFIKSHAWFEKEGDVAVIGISEFASTELGDVTFVELPEIGKTVAAGEAYGNIESVKAANELFTPIAGTVCEVNTELETHPELVNEEPEGKGWIVKLNNLGATAELLSPEEYLALVK